METKQHTAQVAEYSCQQKLADGSTMPASVDSGTAIAGSGESYIAPAVSAPGVDETATPNAGSEFLMDRCVRSDGSNDGVPPSQVSAGGVITPETGREYSVSFFENFGDTKPSSLLLNEFIDRVRGDEWKSITLELREKLSRSKGDYKASKKGMPCVTPSGVFAGGHTATQLVKHSGLIGLDFDLEHNLRFAAGIEDVMDALGNDKFVVAVFRSLSGTGIAVLCRIDPSSHKQAHKGLCAYFLQEYGLEQDPQNTSEVCRLRYVCWDPDARYNPDAVAFDRYVESGADMPAKEGMSLPVDLILSPELARAIESALSVLSPDDRGDWLSAGWTGTWRQRPTSIESAIMHGYSPGIKKL